MKGRERPVTRPSVYHTRNAERNAASAAAALRVSSQSNITTIASPSSLSVIGGGPRGFSSPLSVSQSEALQGRSPRSAPASTSNIASSFSFLNPVSGISTAAQGTSTKADHGMQQAAAVRTFTQVSGSSPLLASLAQPASHDAQLMGRVDSSRPVPVSSVEMAALEGLLQRPLAPDTIREAVCAYLEATDRHDVVMTMLTDERRHGQRGVDAEEAPTASHSPRHTSPQAQQLLLGRRGNGTGSAGDARGNGQDTRRARQRRSQDLLRKSLTDRFMSERGPKPGLGTKKPPIGDGVMPQSWRREPERSSTAPSSPLGGLPASENAANLPTGHCAKPAATHRQHLPRVLPTLCGLEDATRPHLTLLFMNLEERLLAQYRELHLPPPSLEAVRFLVAQTYEPLWSVGEDANTFELPPPCNPVTGAVLYGTINQLVEQLTSVRVTPLSSPSGALVKSAKKFTQAFLRQHRLLLPSQALLAKLMERFLVPLSVRLGFEDFWAHGITVHAPDFGASLPKRRSQSETIRHGRRHPGTSAGMFSSVVASANRGAMGRDERAPTGSGMWGTSVQRRTAPGGDEEDSTGHRRVSATMKEYLLATAPSAPSGAPNAATSRFQEPLSTSIDSMAVLAQTTDVRVSGGTGVLGDGASEGPGRSVTGAVFSTAGGNGGFYAAANGDASATRAYGELVETYSPSAALWLMVCEQVQTRVLSVLLFWIQHHPHHFDSLMISSVLHFIENSCYGPCMWADAPSRLPQIAEFIRSECHRALVLKAAHDKEALLRSSAYAAPATSAHFSTEWLPGVLCGAWDWRQQQLLWQAIPPSLRVSLQSQTLPWTWLTPMRSLKPSQYLPCFAFRAPPSLGFIMAGSDDRHPTVAATSPAHTATSVGENLPGSVRGTTSGGAGLYAAAQRALKEFAAYDFETYIQGLTAAHIRLFTAFPPQDIIITAQSSDMAYLSSAAFQQSFIACFLNSSVMLTSWAASLLLCAAYLDGEDLAAAAAVATSPTFGSSVLASGISGFHRSATGAEQHTGDTSSDHSGSLSMSLSSESSSQSTASTARAAGPASQTGNDVGDATEDKRPWSRLPKADGQPKPLSPNPAHQLLHVLDRLVDLIVGFLRVNNLHACYSIFKGLQHPFVLTLLHHTRVAPHVRPQTAHRIRKLTGLFTPARQGSGGDTGAAPGVEGATTEVHKGRGVERGRRTTATTFSAPPSFEQVEGNGVARTDHVLGRDGAAGGHSRREVRKATHRFFEYLHNVPDSVEYPTVPVVQFYLRELQTLLVQEPAILTVPSNGMQSRFVSGAMPSNAASTSSARTKLARDGPREDGDTAPDDGADSPMAVVNWRKLHIMDDWVQRIHAHQMSCLHYIAAMSTVVRHIAPRLEFEKAFEVQLAAVVMDATILQEMAARLYTAL